VSTARSRHAPDCAGRSRAGIEPPFWSRSSGVIPERWPSRLSSYACEMAHYIFNVMSGDGAPGPVLREQATRSTGARMWAINRDERHRDAFAPGDLVLIYLGAPERKFIGRAELASAVHAWTRPIGGCMPAIVLPVCCSRRSRSGIGPCLCQSRLRRRRRPDHRQRVRDGACGSRWTRGLNSLICRSWNASSIRRGTFANAGPPSARSICDSTALKAMAALTRERATPVDSR